MEIIEPRGKGAHMSTLDFLTVLTCRGVNRMVTSIILAMLVFGTGALSAQSVTKKDVKAANHKAKNTANELARINKDVKKSAKDLLKTEKEVAELKSELRKLETEFVAAPAQ